MIAVFAVMQIQIAIVSAACPLSCPTITSITPQGGVQGATVPVTITGTNLTGGVIAPLNDILITTLSTSTNTQIDAIFSIFANADTTTNRQVSVSGSNTAYFEVVPAGSIPQISSMIPNSAPAGADVEVTLSGTNFDYIKGGSLGPYITNDEPTVSTNTSVVVVLHIAANAVPGPQSIILHSYAGDSTPFTFTITSPNSDSDSDGISNDAEQALTGSSTGLNLTTPGLTDVTADINNDGTITFEGTLTTPKETPTSSNTFSMTLPEGSTVPSNFTIEVESSFATYYDAVTFLYKGYNITPAILPAGTTKSITVENHSSEICLIDGLDQVTIESIIYSDKTLCHDPKNYRVLIAADGAWHSYTFPDGPRLYRLTSIGNWSVKIEGLKHSAIYTFVDADNDNVVDAFDACPGLAGTSEFQGCDCAVSVRSKTNAPGQPSKATASMVTLFDKATLNSCTGFSPNDPATALACDTINQGSFDPLVSPNGVVLGHSCGKQLYVTSESNTKVSGHDIGNNNATAPQPKKALVAFHINSAGELSGTRTSYKSGSTLWIAEPVYTNISGPTVYYPFSFMGEDIPAGENWEVDVCTTAPEGYRLADGQPCRQTFVANETKVLEFELVEVGTKPPRNQHFTLNFKNPKGQKSTVESDVENRMSRSFCKAKGIKCDEKGLNSGDEDGFANGQADVLGLSNDSIWAGLIGAILVGGIVYLVMNRKRKK